jgi:hypothetical protein
MRKSLSSALMIAAIAISALLPATAAHAAPTIKDKTNPAISYALENEPGGVVVNDTTVVWPEKGMTLTVPSASGFSTLAVGSCATGSVCAFSSSNLGGAKLSWTGCGSYSTAALSTVGSIANARSSGTLQARNGATVVASVGPNSWTNVFSRVSSVRCS